MSDVSGDMCTFCSNVNLLISGLQKACSHVKNLYTPTVKGLLYFVILMCRGMLCLYSSATDSALFLLRYFQTYGVKSDAALWT